jgi:cephalosporin hydroxylase
MKQRAVGWAKRAYLAFYTHPRMARLIVNQFHRLYYHTPVPTRTWERTHWLGTPVRKCPLDLWIYQEIIHELRPDLIVECGTAYGGSALFFASMLDLVGKGKVVSVDICDLDRPRHPRVEYLLGSSVDPPVVDRVRGRVAGCECVVVILDSDHSMQHVLAEMRAYSGFVSPGSYLVVEDTNVNGHPVAPNFGPGPLEAVRAFLDENDGFDVDPIGDKFHMSFNPGGYLRRTDGEARRTDRSPA